MRALFLLPLVLILGCASTPPPAKTPPTANTIEAVSRKAEEIQNSVAQVQTLVAEAKAEQLAEFKAAAGAILTRMASDVAALVAQAKSAAKQASSDAAALAKKDQQIADLKAQIEKRDPIRLAVGAVGAALMVGGLILLLANLLLKNSQLTTVAGLAMAAGAGCVGMYVWWRWFAAAGAVLAAAGLYFGVRKISKRGATDSGSVTDAAATG